MKTTIQDLVRLATSTVQEADGQKHIFGITGPPGAGKSTLTAALVRECRTVLGKTSVVGLPMDGFHLPNAVLRARGLQRNKGAPQTFDAKSFIARLAELTSDPMDTTMWPGYSRESHEPIEAAIAVPLSVRLIFVEGNYLLLQDPPWDKAREFLDSVWYVQASMATIKDRLRQRQIEAGRAAEAAAKHVAQTDLTNARLIARTKPLADCVVEISSSDPLLQGLTDPATGRTISLFSH